MRAGFVDFGSKTPGVTPPLEKRIHPSGLTENFLATSLGDRPLSQSFKTRSRQSSEYGLPINSSLKKMTETAQDVQLAKSYKISQNLFRIRSRPEKTGVFR